MNVILGGHRPPLQQIRTLPPTPGTAEIGAKSLRSTRGPQFLFDGERTATKVRVMKMLLPPISCLLAVVGAGAAIQTELVEYKQGETALEGFMAHDTSIKGKRPGVLIVHQWKGLGDYEKKRAEMLAQLGYSVLAVDIYGKGIRADNPKD